MINIKTPFEILMEHLFNELRKKPQPLATIEIEKAIDTSKKMIDSFGLENYLKVITNSSDYEIPKVYNLIDWNLIRQEIERCFCVLVKEGTMVSSPGEIDRTWWSSKQKITSDLFYWNRYKQFLSSFLTPVVVRNLDDDTDLIMNYLGDPALQNFSIYGMVVGHVQSGKTSNYSALIDKAADAGYKFIVVIAGTMNNLRNQTQNRLYESFIGKKGDFLIGVGKYENDPSRIPISLTNEYKDFNKNDADKIKHTFNFDNIKSPILLVIKKESNTLENVVNWLKTQYPNGISNHAMLMIDDESDYASINTREKEDPTIINKKIRMLLSLFEKTSYVAFTATPYANIFIDHEAENSQVGLDLFPKDFIYLLEPPSNYKGAKHYFLENSEEHIIPIKDFVDYIPIDHKINHKIYELPQSLKEAIFHFYLNVGVRHERGNVNSHNSMLIHVSRFTDIHIQIRDKVEELVNSLTMSLKTRSGKKYPYDNDQNLIELNKVYKKYFANSTIDFKNILSRLFEAIDSFIIRDVHSKTKVPLEYRDVSINAIVIGGTSLSRGYTLEGLSISYFLRTTILFDTLMQMGRWFGYREGYSDLCKIFIPQDIESNFRDIISSTEELFQDFRDLAKSKKTPLDFGLAIKQDPNSALQITARNKQKNIKSFNYIMKFDGRLKETVKFNADIEAINNNFNIGIETINTLLKKYKYLEVGSSYLWENVNKDIINKFLGTYNEATKNDPLGIISKMPLPFLREYALNRNTAWDVALISGDSKRKFDSSILIESINISRVIRNMIFKNENNYYHYPKNQLSIPRDESIPLIANNVNLSDYGTDRKIMRKIRSKPLLILYIIESEIKELNTTLDNIMGFSVSVDGDIDSNTHMVKMLVNTVYYQNLLDNLDDNFDDEN
jgi:hypothetical protein